VIIDININEIMRKKKFLITICPENSQELSDLIEILNHVVLHAPIDVNLISLSSLYKDNSFNKILSNANFNFKLLEVEPFFKSNIPFSQINLIKKIITVLSRKKMIDAFIKDSDIILIGIQSVFQRLIYSLSHEIPLVSYHRAILFNLPKSNNRTGFLSSGEIFRLIRAFRFDYLISPRSGVGYADYYLVVGETNKKYLELNGVSAKKILITGSPAHDKTEKFKDNSNKLLDKKFINLYYITSAFEWIGDAKGEKNQIKKIHRIIELCRNNKNIKLTLRIHPREPIEKYQDLERKHPHLAVDYYKSTNLFKDLGKYDIICGGLSNVLFEAMPLDKVAIFYLLPNEISFYQEVIDFTKIKYFTDIEQIKNFINEIKISDKVFSSTIDGQRGIVKKIIYHDPQKNASKRIGDFLIDLMNGKK